MVSGNRKETILSFGCFGNERWRFRLRLAFRFWLLKSTKKYREKMLAKQLFFGNDNNGD